MKIGVDIRVLMDKHYSGISGYTANLLAAISRQNAALATPDDYRLFYNSFRDLSGRLNKWQGAHAKVIATHWPNKIFNYFLQSVLAWPKLDQVLGGTDIFWSPHFNFTRLSGGPDAPKRIITVHDLSFLHYPEFFSARKNFWHQALRVKKMLRSADHLVAVSENTKNDIIELAGIAPEKVSVIYSGLDAVPAASAATNASDQEFLDKHELNGRFILYLGNIEPRKNIAGLIAAFDALRAQAEADEKNFQDLRLVLAGASGWKNRAVYRAWQKSPYRDSIKFLGYVSATEKESLLRQAAVFAYPSFYEGFGFPPLEAMARGVPVVCSNVSSLPEVAGNAALMVNPFRPAEIRTALELVLTDQRLRTRMIKAGYEQAARFSCDKTAAEYLALFKSIK